MPFELIELPFDDNALAPAISAETLSYHHGKHHRAYVEKTNQAIAGTDLDQADLETVIARARKSDRALFNNAAQAWNHGFYWHSLAPESGEPSERLGRLIDDGFGSLASLKERLAKAGAGHFASGWVWLAEEDGMLVIKETHDADTLADAGEAARPLLVIDLWEHAYYLDHQNARPAYLEAVIDRHLAWDFADANLDRAGVWRYPAGVYAD